MTARPNCPAVIFSTLRRHPKPPEATRSDTKRHEATLSYARTNGATGGLTLL